MSKFANITLIAKEKYKEMAWKNGKGRTLELEKFPAGVELEKGQLHWRISRASFAESTEFSQFPGLSRTVMPLNKSIKILNESQGEDVLLPIGGHYNFSGDDKVIGAPFQATNEVVEDVGVIFDASLKRVDIGAFLFKGIVRSFVLPKGVTYFMSGDSPFSCTIFPGGQEFSLKPGDSLRVELDEQDPTETIIMAECSDNTGLAVSVNISNYS